MTFPPFATFCKFIMHTYIHYTYVHVQCKLHSDVTISMMFFKSLSKSLKWFGSPPSWALICQLFTPPALSLVNSPTPPALSLVNSPPLQHYHWSMVNSPPSSAWVHSLVKPQLSLSRLHIVVLFTWCWASLCCSCPVRLTFKTANCSNMLVNTVEIKKVADPANFRSQLQLFAPFQWLFLQTPSTVFVVRMGFHI